MLGPRVKWGLEASDHHRTLWPPLEKATQAPMVGDWWVGAAGVWRGLEASSCDPCSPASWGLPGRRERAVQGSDLRARLRSPPAELLQTSVLVTARPLARAALWGGGGARNHTAPQGCHLHTTDPFPPTGRPWQEDGGSPFQEDRSRRRGPGGR